MTCVQPIDLHFIERYLLGSAGSATQAVALRLLHELKVARLALGAIRDAHDDVQFDTPEDSALQAKAVAMADKVLARTTNTTNHTTKDSQ